MVQKKARAGGRASRSAFVRMPLRKNTPKTQEAIACAPA